MKPAIVDDASVASTIGFATEGVFSAVPGSLHDRARPAEPQSTNDITNLGRVMVQVPLQYITDFQAEICHLKETVVEKDGEIRRLYGLLHLNTDIWHFYSRTNRELETLLRPYLDPKTSEEMFPLSHHSCSRARCCCNCSLPPPVTHAT
ncbi:hypothetical protein OH76DRAFT_1490234 [Lentinus brumalis]|uniref:Uncharacterized protein n=1 Tax=Lentinus brumalis TaxID=2498619 RepID=A0A371CJP2_9APHY|nr:hypothetical protein OH76DRAFT_1490234 [Polyporus brumalis]